MRGSSRPTSDSAQSTDSHAKIGPPNGWPKVIAKGEFQPRPCCKARLIISTGDRDWDIDPDQTCQAPLAQTAKPSGDAQRLCLFPQRCRFGTRHFWGCRTGVQAAKRPCPTNYAVALRYTLGCDVCHCPRLFDPVSAPKDSKAASAPTLSGFAFVPQCVPFSRTASAGLSNRSEVMRQTSPSSSPFRSKDAGTPQSDGEA